MDITLLTADTADLTNWLTRTETLHRTLRPNLGEYADYIRLMFSEGVEMAVLTDDGAVCALGVYRRHHTTFHGLRFYVDDLVTNESKRSKGYGAKLLSWLESRARDLGCDAFDLESGVQRESAHRFYFRERMSVFSFGFTKPLT